MRYVEVAGLRLSAVGLGTWQFGSRDWAYGQEYATTTAPALVRRALDLGVNVFDTAEAYAFGRSERILGEALGERRSEAFVATKLFPVLPVPQVVLRRARASARRLRTDAIDLYQLHWPNPVVPPRVTMPALRQLEEEGTLRHVGVSNYSLGQWRAAEEALGSAVLSNQVRFNLIDRRPEHELLGWAQENDRLLIAYSPLAQGILSGRYGPGQRVRGVRAGTPAFLPENLRRVQPLLEVLRQVAEAHGCTPSQAALAWLLGRRNVVAIPGASSLQQLEANVAAADIELADREDEALLAAARAYRPLAGRELVRAMAAARADGVRQRIRRVTAGLEA